MISFMRKQPSWYYITGSSKDFVIWFIDDCHIKWTDSIVHVQGCESLLWLLNKIYLQIISVITELEKKCKRDQHTIFYNHVCNI